MRVIISCLVFGAILSVGCVNREAQAQAKRTEKVVSDTVVPVQVENVEPMSWVNSLEITGNITTGNDVSVGPKMGGRLVAVYVKEGDSVSSGQIVAVLESTEERARLRQAQAQADSARAQLNQAIQDARVGPQRSKALVGAARARLAQAESSLLKLKNGARTEERAQAETQVRAAKTNLEISKRDLERAETLLREGAIAQKELDRARGSYANALANYENAIEQQRLVLSGARDEDIRQAEAAVRAARESLNDELAKQTGDVNLQERVRAAQANYSSTLESIALAQEALSDVSIRAPFSGKVAGKPLPIGTFAGPGTPVVRLVSKEGLYFEGEVPETSIARVVPGMPVSVFVQAANGATLGGKVNAISPSSESLGRLFKVRIGIANGAGLSDGMFARGTIELGRQEGVLTVPAVAVQKDSEGNFLYVISAGKAVRTPIKVIGTQSNRTAVEGVAQGQQVVIKGQAQLANQATVRIEEAK